MKCDRGARDLRAGTGTRANKPGPELPACRRVLVFSGSTDLRGGCRHGSEGHLVAELLELADETSGFALGITPAQEVVVA